MCSSNCQTGIFPAAAIRQVLSETAGAVMISVFLLLPAVFMGESSDTGEYYSRVYVSVTLVGILSAGTSWNKLTASMRTFRIRHCLFFYTGYYAEIYFCSWRNLRGYSDICRAQIGGKKTRTRQKSFFPEYLESHS